MFKLKTKPTFGWAALWFSISSSSGLIACRSELGDTGVIDRPFWVPAHYPPLPQTIPEFTDAQLELGRWLFYDVRLSQNGTRSCGTCHEQIKAFTDGLAQGLGINNSILPLNTLSLANVAWRTELTWSSQLETVESHMRIPLFNTNPVEMGMTDELIIERLTEYDPYNEMFDLAYPTDGSPISVENTIAAIAAFTTTIVDGQSEYDKWLQGESQFSPEAQEGHRLFYGDEMKCGACHGGLFFDQPDPEMTAQNGRHGYFNTGQYHINAQGDYPPQAQGLIEQTGKAEDMGRFRTPSLRNLSFTKPWLHDGTEFTVDSILQAYARGGRKLESGAFPGDGHDNPYKSELIEGFTLTEDRKMALMAFLNTLDDPNLLENPRLKSPFCIQQAGEIINAPCETPYLVNENK